MRSPCAAAQRASSDAAIAYVAGAGRPFFLFAHYQCTHEPYVKHAAWDFGDTDVDRYDSALAYCDQELGRLLQAIEQRPDASRTAIVVYSDHGELFGEHGFHAHGNSLFEPDVRVLLLARAPGTTERTVTAPVMLTDLAPTLLELAGVPRPASRDARSLVPLFSRPVDADFPSRPLFLFGDLWRATTHYEARAVVADGFKYIRYQPSGIEQLFDLGRDPAESQNVAVGRSELRARMSRMLDGWEASVR